MLFILVLIGLLYGAFNSLRWTRDRVIAGTVDQAVHLATVKIGPASDRFRAEQRRSAQDHAELGLAPPQDPSWKGFDRVQWYPNDDVRFEFHSGDGTEDHHVFMFRLSAYREQAGVSCGARGISPRALALAALRCDDRVEPPPPAAVAGPLPTRPLPTAADRVLEAVSNDDEARLRRLREEGLDLCAADSTGRLALAEAVRGNQFKALTFLLTQSCDINAIEPISGRTALMAAAFARNPSLAHALLEGGANPALSTSAGDSAWFLAGAGSDGASLSTRDALRLRGVDVNTRDASGRTMLMIAADRGELGLVNWLLNNNAQPDVQDAAGRSALMYAVLSASGEPALPLLLKHKTALDLKDAQGKSALDLTWQISDPMRQSRCIAALKAAGAQSR